MILKQAAVRLGSDPATMGTHSVRRGAATIYMMSGAEYHQVKFCLSRSTVEKLGYLQIKTYIL